MAKRLKRGESLVVATHNKGKLREFADLLAPFAVKSIPAGVLGLAEPEETGSTFEENATLKALAASAEAGLVALADDSGIVVETLGGEPGVLSARWAGPKKDFAVAMRTIQERLISRGATVPEMRRAAFVAVLCLALPDGTAETFRGEVEGTLVWPPRGKNGFGYDPMFVPAGHDRTFSEMMPEEKHALSHRARAFARLAEARLTR